MILLCRRRTRSGGVDEHWARPVHVLGLLQLRPQRRVLWDCRPSIGWKFFCQLNAICTHTCQEEMNFQCRVTTSGSCVRAGLSVVALVPTVTRVRSKEPTRHSIWSRAFKALGRVSGSRRRHPPGSWSESIGQWFRTTSDRLTRPAPPPLAAPSRACRCYQLANGVFYGANWCIARRQQRMKRHARIQARQSKQQCTFNSPSSQAGLLNRLLPRFREAPGSRQQLLPLRHLPVEHPSPARYC